MANLWRRFWCRVEEILTGHNHDWGLFEEWGITFQERTCNTCGYRQILDR